MQLPVGKGGPHEGPSLPWQVTESDPRIWSSAQAHWRPRGVARHRLLQPPLLTRHLLEPTAEAKG